MIEMDKAKNKGANNMTQGQLVQLLRELKGVTKVWKAEAALGNLDYAKELSGEILSLNKRIRSDKYIAS